MNILERLFQPESGYPRRLMWRMVAGNEAAHLAPLLEQAMAPYKISRPRIFHAARLPFYTRAELVRWRNTGIRPEMDSYGITDGKILVVLESKRDLDRANVIAGIQLDANTALDYLRFIGSRRIWGGRTPIGLVESVEDVLPAAAYSTRLNLDEIRPVIAERILAPQIAVSEATVIADVTLEEHPDLYVAKLHINRATGRYAEVETELVYHNIPTFSMPTPF